MNIQVSDEEYMLLMDSIRVHIGQCQKHAEVMQQCADSGGNPMVPVEAAQRMSKVYAERREELIALELSLNSQR